MLVDSGTSCLCIPPEYYQKLLDSVELSCKVSGLIANCQYDPDELGDDYDRFFPDIILTADGVDYMFSEYAIYRNNFGRSSITLMLMECNPREWIVGLNFFQNYYMIFDDENA